jgi:hypothetical protein
LVKVLAVLVVLMVQVAPSLVDKVVPEELLVVK